MILVISYLEQGQRLAFGALKEHTESFLRVPSKNAVRYAVKEFEKKHTLGVKAISWKVVKGF